MSVVSLFSLLLISAGAVVMAVCIRRFGPEVRKLKQVSEKEYAKISSFATFHISLMVFFLVGYVPLGCPFSLTSVSPANYSWALSSFSVRFLFC